MKGEGGRGKPVQFRVCVYSNNGETKLEKNGVDVWGEDQ